MAIKLSDNIWSLLERIASDLAECRDPFARHWLLMPGSGCSEWVLRCWARKAGAAAHSQVVPLRSVIEQVACGEGEPFSRERLTLAIAQSLGEFRGLSPLPAHVAQNGVDAQVLAWSQRLADAIDVGLLCRENQQDWHNSTLLTALLKHPRVIAALVGHIGQQSRDEYRVAVRRWKNRWETRGGAPRLWVLLDAGLPHHLMRALADLVDALGDRVHLSLFGPSHVFWGDLRLKRRWVQGAAGPVLTSFGRQAQDLQNQSIDHFVSEGTGGEELASAERKNTLLGLVQASCRDACAPSTKALVHSDDWSLTVHACRSHLRELEICRDRILQALREDASLRADEILVLLANPLVYAPLASAALSPLPTRVLGLGGALVSPVASGLMRLLRSLHSRLGLADIQALIDEPLIAERFGFTGLSTELVSWLADAQFRWGIDAEHRADTQGDGERRWSFAFALRRLALGAVVGAGPEILDADVPLERAAGLSTAVLAQLARFASALHSARKAWVEKDDSAGKPMQYWCDLLSEWSTSFLGEGTGAVSEQRTHLINTIIPNLRSAAPDGLLLRSDAVLRLIEAALQSLNVEHGAGGGGITVADLHQYAGTPASLVVVVGLGAEGFPRHEDRPEWHPLSTNREAGDPDVRDADRHALLLCLLSARERVVLVYQGGSDEDARERPPSTPVADLLSAVDEIATLPNRLSVAQNIHIKHGLNGFSPAACANDARDLERTHNVADYAGAAALQCRAHSDYPGLWSQVLDATFETQEITLRDLTELFQEPCRIFVRRLGLHLPEESSELSQADALELDGLGRWSLRDQLLRCRIDGSDEEKLLARLEAAGDRPRGLYGDAVLHQSLSELPGIDACGLSAVLEPMQLTIDGRTLSATLPDGWFTTPTGGLVYCSASKRSRKKSLAVTLGLLCLAATRGVTQVQTWFRSEKTAKTVLAPEPSKAAELLAGVIRLYTLAQRLPLPFWPEAYERLCRLAESTRSRGHQEPTRESMLSAAWSTWSLGVAPDLASAPESKLTATRVCFRGLADPFTWTPPLTVDWLPGHGTPLAWRLYRFVSAWESTVRVTA